MGTMLSQVTTEPKLRPPRIVLHGKGGVGKTTFGASMQMPIVLPAEDGIGKLHVPQLPRPDSYEDVMNALAELHNEEHAYRTLVVDTIDHVEPLVWRKVCEAQSKGNKQYDSIEDFGYQKGYIYADAFWTEFFHSLDALRRKGMTIVVLCHNDVRTINDPVIGPYDALQPKLHKRANALMYEWADIVAFLDLEKAAHEKEGARGKKMRTSQMLGERVLYLEDVGGFEAKNRYDLPPRLEVPKDNPYGPLRAALAKALGIGQANGQAKNGEEAA